LHSSSYSPSGRFSSMASVEDLALGDSSASCGHVETTPENHEDNCLGSEFDRTATRWHHFANTCPGHTACRANTLMSVIWPSSNSNDQLLANWGHQNPLAIATRVCAARPSPSSYFEQVLADVEVALFSTFLGASIRRLTIAASIASPSCCRDW